MLKDFKFDWLCSMCQITLYVAILFMTKEQKESTKRYYKTEALSQICPKFWDAKDVYNF